jgi:uroporphyrinogen-III decarboxylase
MAHMPKNPISFETELTREQLNELSLYTQFARTRLMERDISVAELKRKFLAGEKPDRPPLLLADFPSRLIGGTLCDYHVDTVAHYKAYCAAIARFGEDLAGTYTFTWEFKIVEFLGGKVSYIDDSAPETIAHPFTSEQDLETAPALDIESLVAEDLALKTFVDKMLGDLLGPGTFIGLDPFSQVCSLLHNPQKVFESVIENPRFVHALCTYMYEVEREVYKRVAKVGPTVFFLPGFTLMLSPVQFNEFALPYIEKLLADIPGAPMVIGCAGNATHLVEPLMKSPVPVAFFDASSDLNVIVEQSRHYNKPFTIMFPRTVLMKGDRNEIRSTTKQLLTTAKDVPFYLWNEAIMGGSLPSTSIDMFIEAYREFAHYPIDEYVHEGEGSTAKRAREELKPEDVKWEESGEKALKTIPIVFRKMVRSELQKIVAAKGIKVITEEVFFRIKKEMGY